ncbi:MAG: ECF transporter S component [bacterium]
MPKTETKKTRTAVALAHGFGFWIARVRERSGGKKKGFGVGLLAVVFVIAGVSLGLALKDPAVAVGKIALVDALSLLAYAIIAFFLVKFHVSVARTKVKGTRRLAFLGIVVGLASVLMLLGFPIIPNFYFLKVELSGLIIFMTLLWFDWKTAALVSVATNFINVFMPGTPPVIVFLDQGVNFIATMIFLLPATLALRRAQKPKSGLVLAVSLAGVVVVTVVMTLYNAFINLPLIYHITMPFVTVMEVFGVFNAVKWGIVAIAVSATWQRLYSLRSFRDDGEGAEETT